MTGVRGDSSVGDSFGMTGKLFEMTGQAVRYDCVMCLSFRRLEGGEISKKCVE